MRRIRRFFALVALISAAFGPISANADSPPDPVTITNDDEKMAKEVERLHEDGDYDAAFALAEKLVTLREQKFGKEHPRTAAAMADLGALYAVKGDTAAAEPLIERAVAILQNAKDSDDLYAGALVNLGQVYKHKGDFKRAQAAIERAIAIEEKAGAARLPNLGQAIAALGILHMRMGQLAQAKEELLRAVGIHEKHGTERDLFVDLTNLGGLYRGLGDELGAVDAYNRAVPIGERVLGPDHPNVGKLHHFIGIYLTSSSQYQRAEEQFGKAETCLVKALGPEHPDVGKMYSDWAVLLTRTGQPERALELRDKAQVIEEQWLSNALASGTEEDKLSYAAQMELSMDRVISFQMGMNLGSREATRFILRTILRNKAQALEASAAGTASLRERMTPENKKRLDDVVRVRGKLASMYTRGPRGQTVAQFKEETQRLSREADALDATISAETSQYRRSVQNVTLESVAARIPEDAALIEFAQYRHYNAHFYSASSERESTTRFMMYVLRHNGNVMQFQLSVPGAVIEEKVATIRKGMQNPKDTKVYRELSLLHDIIFIRLTPLLPGVKHLLISPDGDLSLVPFAALIDPEGQVLARRYNITYLSSGRDLLHIGERDLKSSAPMLFANPDYDAPGEPGQTKLPAAPKGSLPALARVRFPPLPGTAQEAEAIRKIVPGPDVRLKRVATESAIKKVSGPKILHVATHGFFLDENGQAKRGARGLELEVPIKSLPAVPTESGSGKIRAPNPMFLSGLALAGANVRKGQTDDGILTAYEASALDLSGTELVVLSACETGIGSRVAREGVRGLRRALVMAGSETQVMSLWQVDDNATRDLMTAFYANMFHKGMGRGEAMRAAQLTLFDKPATQHPFYWASFIVSGNWAPISNVVPGAGAGGGIVAPPGGACGCRITSEEHDEYWVSILMAGFVLAHARRASRKTN